ncbi:auxin-responsive protein SAUR36-like [Rhodamnia argentea]|uniref:Auxin-responsive protein SAUR36-like n=1 Tax=Rhodamnia argentea TaxID=178133 RepID=A0A8B8PL35_9MYRT|nr:auxin-responsive protein SAUR36-like [Rhodamnia argentea]
MIMGDNKTRGLSLKKRLFRVSKCITGRTRGYSRLSASPPGPCAINPMSKLLSWCRCLTSKRTKSLCSSKPWSGDAVVGQDPVGERPTGTMKVPKGHLAVYVGQRSGELRRVLVPAVYFNHPLFGDLLREAEEEFGFSHRGGGITIPCEVSEFERVKSRVATATGYCGRRRSTWKKHLLRKI